MLLFVFGGAAFVQISFWMALWFGLRRARNAGRIDGLDPPDGISVVVAARNAARQLPELLEALSRQSHPAFEVVVVDDGSEDETVEVAESVARRDPRFRVETNPTGARGESGKKRAVAAGIAAAGHRLLALTDADCRPRPDWLRSLATAQSSEPSIVVGYAPYATRTTFLNRLVRFETFSTALMTAGAIGLGLPYMAVGRNLSFSKEIWFRASRRREGEDLISGVDDLFVQAASAAGARVRYLFHRDSFVSSDPPESVVSWIRQKRRHLSASRAYRPLFQTLLAAFHGSALFCWIAPLVLGWPGLALLAVRFAVYWPIASSWAPQFDEEGLTAPLPLLDAALLAFLVVVAPVGILFPPKEW